MVEKHFGGFPDTDEIVDYEKYSGEFKNKDSGINGIILKDDETLWINFYDSVGAYGGGSSRVGCMAMSTRFTALQFPTIKNIIMCIDKYPNEGNKNCALDFQP